MNLCNFWTKNTSWSPSYLQCGDICGGEWEPHPSPHFPHVSLEQSLVPQLSMWMWDICRYICHIYAAAMSLDVNIYRSAFHMTDSAERHNFN